MNRVDEIREILSEFVDYDEGKALRKELKKIADKTYIQKYSDKEHVDFLDRNEAEFEEVHPQDENEPYYLEMFTIVTQHIYGDNIRQLIDKGIDIERFGKNDEYEFYI